MAAKAENLHNRFQNNFLMKPYRVWGFLFILFITAGLIYEGFVQDTTSGIAEELLKIFIGPDILVTDYIHTAGFGAALVNVGLSGLAAVTALVIAKHEPSGLTMGTLGLTTGVAFFGKNPYNMLPIILGGFLYAKVSKIPPGYCVLRAVLATCLAPAVTQIAYVSGLPFPVGLALGFGIGILIGFLINPVAIHKESAHMGYNLYNVGFATGILAMGIYALYSLVGYSYETYDNWSSGYDIHLMILLTAVSLYFVICGALCKGERLPFYVYFKFHADDRDFFKKYREKAYIHMGFMGFACFAFMLIVRGEFNGPVIGAILSVIGFGAFGKALLSAAPVVSGAMLAAFTSSVFTGIPLNDKRFLVAAIFSTCLSPLAKQYGVFWGMAAGFLHLSLAVNSVTFHGGLNLYNNGFAGGLAAMILFPIINFFLRNKETHDDAENDAAD